MADEVMIWRGKKAEGMSRRKKEKLMKWLELLLVVNHLATERMGREAMENFDAERAEKIKREYKKDIKKRVTFCHRLPESVLAKIDDIELFCFGYFKEEARKAIVEYYYQNVEE